MSRDDGPPVGGLEGVARGMIHHADDWLTVYGGDARDVLAELPDASVHCVVTSPPYWGLRDYGTATWIGGDAGCDHLPDAATLERQNGRASTLVGTTTSQKQAAIARHDCKCGATRQDSQLGLEATPEEYVANLVAVFREVRRVLRDDGTLWLNLGDSYTGNYAGGTQTQTATSTLGPNRDGLSPDNHIWTKPHPARSTPVGLKPKDLVGIPWRVAFALQADGWWLRSDIIWSKPNPMPESVTDRPTKAHEYLFLLAKSERYYFDQEAVRETQADESNDAYRRALASPRQPADWKQNGAVAHIGAGPTVSPNAAWSDPEKLERLLSRGRNLRSVWTIATRPYPGAHFAVFPPELPERCIKAGSSERGVCPQCGAPWRRVTETARGPIADELTPKHAAMVEQGLVSRKTGLKNPGWRKEPIASSETTGWEPTCNHQAAEAADREAADVPVPSAAVVLDPFAGSGTVGVVANRLSRRAILIDLNPAYLEQQMKRNAQTPLGLGAA